MPEAWIHALLGGVIIGLSVSLMLVANGRVTGISGIVNGLLSPMKGDTAWRAFFVGGLVLGGLALQALNPRLFENSLNPSVPTVILAGLLVGFGTVMGSGCTSGHGVCGISRFSIRSLLATMVFIAAGVGTVAVVRSLGGEA